MKVAFRFMVVSALALAVGGGCPSENPGGNATEGTTETSGIPTTLTEGPSTTPGGTTEVATGDGGTSTGPSADSGSSTGGSGTAEDTTAGNDPGNPVDCGGDIWQCGNGMDDDGDGFIDLADPECTGPCDDDESSFQTGLPGDNMDCKQDCFFDGNSGSGNDGCIWDLRCDPENPGEFIGCEYTGGNNCDNQPENQEQGCLDVCVPFVPPGCDCFGCCTVQLPDGTSVDIFLNSGPDCSLENIDACTSCTSQIDDCGVPCVPEKCQVCFGETEPPEGCGEVMCPSGDSCDSDMPDSCPPDYFCYLSCCYPPPPG